MEDSKIEFNIWLENVMKQLFTYTPGQQVIAANLFYTEAYKKHEAEIAKDKTILTQKEIVFSKFFAKPLESK